VPGDCPGEEGSVESKGTFGCNLEALDLVQNRVDLELQSDSEATVRLNLTLATKF